MNFQSFEDILDFAIDKEKDTAVFYGNLAEKETFSGARQMWSELAAEERKHQALLENFKNEDRSLATYAYEWIPDMKRSDYLVSVTYTPGMDFAEILRLVIKREEASLRLYNILATRTTDPACVKLFRMLAQEEARHKQTFETLYDDHMARLGD
ncbi:ferritin family protein [Desulfosarcina sp. OttesenSCG-928-A07]|nr:ferritin family protein [Desulfosarcina sp. OttesenSCG-928-G17]MDL2329837.1 ferritin family protein [Desulfosarcina sp. OttesenSCG-928-A07]